MRHVNEKDNSIDEMPSLAEENSPAKNQKEEFQYKIKSPSSSDTNSASRVLKKEVKHALNTKNIKSLKSLMGLAKTPYAKIMEEENQIKQVRCKKFMNSLSIEQRILSEQRRQKKHSKSIYNQVLYQGYESQSVPNSDHSKSFQSVQNPLLKSIVAGHAKDMNKHLSRLNFRKGHFFITNKSSLRNSRSIFEGYD